MNNSDFTHKLAHPHHRQRAVRHAQIPFGNMQARERLFGQLLDSAMELNHLLKDHTLTLTDLADRFNFASLSHFSRYV